MAPTNLQGLNIVQPAQPLPTTSDQQDLLAAPPFPEFSAQLDLWTNLSFESDEPLVRHDDKYSKGKRPIAAAEDFDDDEPPSPVEALASHDSHENVVNARAIGETALHGGAPRGGPSAGEFDLNAILSGFGIDPFHLPPALHASQQGVVAPSLAQLLSMQGLVPNPYYEQLQLAAAGRAEPQLANSSSLPPAKRSRTRKNSVSTVDSPEDRASYSETASASTAPVSPVEDKRRRNTAASARFRLKKKEREAALEQKAKDLEVKVNELEKECESLRRENGWLKGLVVGVTGAGATQQQQQPLTSGARRNREKVDHSEADGE